MMNLQGLDAATVAKLGPARVARIMDAVERRNIKLRAAEPRMKAAQEKRDRKKAKRAAIQGQAT